ncbi:hypothetical protein PMAYCL1PPCAC_23771, partial [Pristionchus mayeri]
SILRQMDDDTGIDESISTEELEKRRLALKMELGSGDDTSDESDQEEGNSGSDEYSTDDHHSLGECDNFEKEDCHAEEVECPAKRSKQEESSDDDEFATQCSESNPPRREEDGSSTVASSNDVENANSLKRKKRIPEYPSADFVLPLPSGWVEAVHDSGVPIYMHRESRVVTLSRPYDLKDESLRKHSIPLGSIPCEQQRRMTEHRQKSGIKLPGTKSEISVPQVELKTMDQLREERLSPDELYDKAKGTFCIKEIMVYKFKNWKAIRMDKKKELIENAMKEETTVDLDGQNPMISVAAGCGAQGTKMKKKGCVLNMVGKTSVTLLHEFVQKILRGVTDYQFAQVKSAINPYSAICFLKTKKEKNELGEMEMTEGGEKRSDDAYNVTLIGRGSGESKRACKLQAASVALRSLIPGINIDERHTVRGTTSNKESVEAFDLLAMDDERVIDFSKRAGKQLPYALLQECIRVNAAWGASKPEEKSERIGHHQHELVMKVGRHEARVTCSSLKDGRQIAAQILLKELYPMMESWGSILRLFSSSNDEHLETARVRQQVVRIAPNKNEKEYGRNEAVLEALRSEMARASTRLRGRMERERGLKGTQAVIHRHSEKEGDTPLPPHSIDL